MEIRISSTFSFLASLNLLLASVVMADHTCYDTWGNSNDGELLPCYSPGTTDLNANTHCCKKGDVCLSNGLCLTPGSHYIMTQQGCTDKAWGKPCSQYCDNKRTLQGTNSAIPLIACPNTLTTGDSPPKFCCGPDASSCCQTASSQLTIPTGTMYQADIVRATFTVTPTSSSSSSDTSFPLKIGLGIGLGLGIPILLVLSAVAYFLARPRYHSTTTSSSRRHLKPGFSKSHGPGGGNSNNHHRNYSTTPSRLNDKDGTRRDSFGRVDTNVGPPSDDGHWDGAQGTAAWPPNGTNNVAAAIAAWALNQNNGPPSPKEMDAGRISRTRMMRRGETPTKFPVELPAHHHDLGGSVQVGVREVLDHRDDAEEDVMELPTPDYEAHPVGGYPLAHVHDHVHDEPDPETHTRSTTVQVEGLGGDGVRSTIGDQVSPLTISSPAVISPVGAPGPPPVLAEGVRGERYIKMIDIKTGRKKGHQQQGSGGI
ncbi:hypothetical protein QBC44DRAFT_162023 [Cladorrhinum sp. PSN332]|nr:hypothetical protein QBC44DRAFT_162023 [Cladorrhinum sp. PSN332]